MSDAHLDDWTRELAGALGLQIDADLVDDVLDLAGDAAHQVARPAAPVTTYLVGLAVGAGRSRAEAIEVVTRLLGARS